MVGVWNERPYSVDYILTLRRHLTEAGLPTVIVAADDVGSTTWRICDDLSASAELRAAVAVVGGHYPQQAISSGCAALPMPKWSSEDFSSEYTAGGCWSRLINRNYVYANLTATISWSPIAAYYDALPYSRVGLMHAAQPWSGHYDVDQALWTTAHTTHFAQPGWHYLRHGSGVGVLDGGGTYVSFTDGLGNLTIVVEAMAHEVTRCVNEAAPPGTATTQNVTFVLGGALRGIAALHAFRSTFNPSLPITQFEYVGAAAVKEGALSFTLLVDSMWTFSTLNSSKGAHAASPPEAAFPLPYADTFDEAAVGKEAKYFTDQSGTFEVAQDSGSRGRVMRQTVVRQPVSWCGPEPYPYSIIGEYGWTAFNVSVDVLVEQGGTALVGAGVTKGGCVRAAGSPGIVLAVSTERGWVVSNSTTLRDPVISGGVAVKAGVWHRIGLVVGSTRSAAYVDGVRVAQVAFGTEQFVGWTAIGSSFDYVRFDNFRVEPSMVMDAAGEPPKQHDDEVRSSVQRSIDIARH